MLKKIKQILLNNHNDSQIMVKNTFWLSISQIASRSIRIIIVIYATRILGAAGYGIFAYALAIIGFLNLFSDLGINWILVREASKNTPERRQYIATTFAIKSTLLIILGLITLFIAPYFTKAPEVRVLLPVMALLSISDGLREFGIAIIRSLEKMELEAGINTFTITITVAISFVALIYYPTPYGLSIAYATSSMLGLGLTIYILRGELNHISQGISHYLIRPIFAAIWPFALTNILWSILNFTDILMVGWLKNVTEVGYYSAAQKPIQLLLVLPGLVATSVLPSMSRMLAQDENKFRRLIERATAIVMLIALPLVSGSLLLGDQLTNMLYGSEYSPSGIIFSILAVAFLVTFPASVINNAIFSRNWQKDFLPYMALGAGLNIILNLALIPSYGATGAAIATVLSQIIAYILVVVVAKKRIGFVIWPLLPKILLATLIMTGTIWLSISIGLRFYLTVLIATVIYFVVLTLLRESSLLRLFAIFKRTNESS